MSFAARTLSLSRHGATRSGEWWRGFRTGLLASLGTVAAAAAATLYVLVRL